MAILALLLQTLVPALHHPASMALGGMTAFDTAQNLCLAAGSTPVAPGGEDKAPHHHRPVCPICQAVHALGGFPPPQPPIFPIAPRHADEPPHAMSAVLATQRTRALPPPRGPPASI